MQTLVLCQRRELADSGWRERTALCSEQAGPPDASRMPPCCVPERLDPVDVNWKRFWQKYLWVSYARGLQFLKQTMITSLEGQLALSTQYPKPNLKFLEDSFTKRLGRSCGMNSKH